MMPFTFPRLRAPTPLGRLRRVAPRLSLQCAAQVRNNSILRDVVLRKEHLTTKALAPFTYTRASSSNDPFGRYIDALDVWYYLWAPHKAIIRDVICKIADVTIIYDDIQDHSILRRGRPAAYKIWGVGQMLNSASYALHSTLLEIEKLPNKDCTPIIIKGIVDAALGQALDLHNTHMVECPIEDEYLVMIRHKTGAFLDISLKLMQAVSQKTGPSSIEKFTTLAGRYLQIRNDYVNLASNEYNAKKGFCGDLDEGKFSFPLVHCFRSLRSGSPQWKELGLELQNTFMTRAQAPAQGFHRELKIRILEIMQVTKSLAYTKEALQALEKELERLLGKMEAESGVRNELFKEYFAKVKV